MAGKRRREDDDGGGGDSSRWMGTYGDMVTLLMAFFVMLYAVSDTSTVKFEALVSGLAGPFNNPSVEMGLLEGQGIQQTDASPLQLVAPTRPGPAADNRTVAETVQDGTPGSREALADAQLEEVEAQLEEALAGVPEGIPISADIRDDERGLVIAITTDEVLFETGSTVVSQDGRVLLGEIAPVLQAAPNTIVVEGHTDDRPLQRGGYTNWNLSTDRAVAVLDILGRDHGISWDRLSAGGYGEHRPLAANDTAEGRATNRRVEILIVGLDISPGDAGAAPPPPAAPGGILDFSEPLPAELAAASIAGVLDGEQP